MLGPRCVALRGDVYKRQVVGNEALVSTAQGRAYGVEALMRWTLPDRLNLTSSFTWYRSEYRADRHAAYVPSAWDNRVILNMSGTYDFPHRWSVGLRLSCIGGSPYTPYDEVASSYVTYWDANGKSAYDYSRYNAERLPGYAQLDVDVYKRQLFFKALGEIFGRREARGISDFTDVPVAA